jgi:fido (protein-threonine AMPylation protein)
VILFEIFGAESNPVYQELEIANGTRQYDFLKSIVWAALAVQRAFLSEHLLKALNFQAIVCLHTNAGEYRPCAVTVGTHQPPEHYRVDALMEDFVNMVNRWWETADPVMLAAYVLWNLNFIHPFINGNGRTARAACYFVLCVKVGQWLPGTTILPELIRRERNDYVAALQSVDASLKAGTLDLTPLHALLTKLLQEQMASVAPIPGANPAIGP